MNIVDGVVVIVIAAAIIGAGGWFFRERLGWFRRRPEPSDSPEDPGPDDVTFDKEKFRYPSTDFDRTTYRINVGPAGVEGRAVPGSIAKGGGLVVIFQDAELSGDGLGVWLTIANPSEKTYRWFGAMLTAYAQPVNANIEAALHEEIGGHLIFDLYPGEQYTGYYFFPVTPDVIGPKFLTCRSSDTDLTFWWARGA